MAVKRPLVLGSNGLIQQLQIADSITVGIPTVSSPSRTAGVAFQPSLTSNCLVAYSVRIVSSSTITGGQVGRWELRSDVNNPPTVVRARVAGGSAGTLLVGLNIVDTSEGVLSFLVPAAWFVMLASVNETGTPTFSITSQVEELL